MNARVKKLHARELSRNQPILRFDIILQHDWPIEQCLLHIRFFFGGKTKRPCFDLFIHWLIKQIMNTCRNHFSRPYDTRHSVWWQLPLIKFLIKFHDTAPLNNKIWTIGPCNTLRRRCLKWCWTFSLVKRIGKAFQIYRDLYFSLRIHSHSKIHLENASGHVPGH